MLFLDNSEASQSLLSDTFKNTRCCKKFARLVMLHVTMMLHRNVHVAGASYDFFQVTSLDHHQQCNYTRFCDHWSVFICVSN